MAHKKAGGSTRLGRDSQSKRLGVKIFGDQHVRAGGIIVRQKGLKYRPSENVGIGADFTLYAKADGVVKFTHQSRRRFTGILLPARSVSVVPREDSMRKTK